MTRSLAGVIKRVSPVLVPCSSLLWFPRPHQHAGPVEENNVVHIFYIRRYMSFCRCSFLSSFGRAKTRGSSRRVFVSQGTFRGQNKPWGLFGVNIFARWALQEGGGPTAGLKKVREIFVNLVEITM